MAKKKAETFAIQDPEKIAKCLGSLGDPMNKLRTARSVEDRMDSVLKIAAAGVALAPPPYNAEGLLIIQTLSLVNALVIFDPSTGTKPDPMIANMKQVLGEYKLADMRAEIGVIQSHLERLKSALTTLENPSGEVDRTRPQYNQAMEFFTANVSEVITPMSKIRTYIMGCNYEPGQKPGAWEKAAPGACSSRDVYGMTKAYCQLVAMFYGVIDQAITYLAQDPRQVPFYQNLKSSEHRSLEELFEWAQGQYQKSPVFPPKVVQRTGEMELKKTCAELRIALGQIDRKGTCVDADK